MSIYLVRPQMPKLSKNVFCTDLILSLKTGTWGVAEEFAQHWNNNCNTYYNRMIIAFCQRQV